MKDSIRLTRKYMKSPVLYILAIVFTTIQGFSEIILPRLMGDIVNDGIMTGSLETVYFIGYKMLILTALLGVSGYFSFVFINISVLKFGNELRIHAYDKITRMNYRKVQEMGGGSVITRLTGDTEKVVSLIKAIVNLVYKPLLLAVGGFFMIFYINLKFGLIFLAFIVVQVSIIVFFIHRTSPMFMNVQRSIDKINTKLQSVLHSMRLIKSSGTESYEEKLFGENSQGLYTRNIEVLTFMSIFNPIVMFIMNITIVVIVVMIGYQSQDDSTTIGNVMMSITYAEQILMSIMISSNLARTISEIKPSLARITEILDTDVSKSDRTGKKIESIGNISLKHVFMAYAEGRDVLKDINISLSKGESVSIVGSTSCGKSTLAQVMGGLEFGTKGEVIIDGEDIGSYETRSLRKHIAVVGAANSGIYSGTFMDNLKLGRDYVSSDSAKEAARAAEIDEFISSQNYGYDSLAYASGNTISGGQRQRLMIARALAGAPDVLILDDSTSSLDYATEKRVIENIRSMYKDMILVLITERKGSAALCDRQYRLTEGGLV